MKSKNRILALSLIAMLAVALFSGCGSVAASAGNKISVITTTFAAYDWAKTIAEGSDNIEVSYLMDSSVDMHSYQPSAEDILKIKGSDVLIAIGGESEDWVSDIAEDDKVIYLMDSVTVSEEESKEGMEAEDEEVADETEYDEHIWLSLKNAVKCVETIKDRFCQLDSAGKTIYEDNAAAYTEELEEVDGQYQNTVDGAPVSTLVFGDRFPFRYMVDDYGLDYYAAFKGCSAETEASFETISFLAGKIDELDLHNICVIDGTDHDIAETIKNNTQSKDQNIVSFNSMQSISNSECDDYSYIEIMKDNLESLKQALEV